jgi:hypothetical protein
MIEAVENHMPEVVVIDEIGTEAECVAARTIAQRGGWVGGFMQRLQGQDSCSQADQFVTYGSAVNTGFCGWWRWRPCSPRSHVQLFSAR